MRRLALGVAIGVLFGVGGSWAWRASGPDQGEPTPERQPAEEASLNRVAPGLWLYELPPGECGSVLSIEVFRHAASGGLDEFTPAFDERC